jgi:hypothetical protein
VVPKAPDHEESPLKMSYERISIAELPSKIIDCKAIIASQDMIVEKMGSNYDFVLQPNTQEANFIIRAMQSFLPREEGRQTKPYRLSDIDICSDDEFKSYIEGLVEATDEYIGGDCIDGGKLLMSKKEDGETPTLSFTLQECWCAEPDFFHCRVLKDNTRSKAENQIVEAIEKLEGKTIRMLSLGPGFLLQELMILARLSQNQEIRKKRIEFTIRDIEPIEPRDKLKKAKALHDLRSFISRFNQVYSMDIVLDYEIENIPTHEKDKTFDIVYAIDYDDSCARYNFCTQTTSSRGLSHQSKQYNTNLALINAFAQINASNKSAFSLFSRGGDIVTAPRLTGNDIDNINATNSWIEWQKQTMLDKNYVAKKPKYCYINANIFCLLPNLVFLKNIIQLY